ncbi:MAG: hypothetical protein AB7L70_19145 [Pyrinomonadaceae bacterium]
MAFKSAFAAARKAGKKTFTYNGKSYNTKLASDTPSKAPTPTANPKKAAAESRRSPVAKRAAARTASSGSASMATHAASERKYKNDDVRSFRKKQSAKKVGVASGGRVGVSGRK